MGKTTRHLRPVGYFDMPDGTPISLFLEMDRLCLDGRVVGQYVGYSRPGIAGSKVKCPTTGEDRPVNSFVQGAWQGKCYLYTISELRMIKANKKFHGRILSICGEALKSWGENTYRKTEKPVQAPLPEGEEKVEELPSGSSIIWDSALADLAVRVGILEAKVNFLVENEMRPHKEAEVDTETFWDDTKAPKDEVRKLLKALDTLVNHVNGFRKMKKGGTDARAGVQKD